MVTWLAVVAFLASTAFGNPFKDPHCVGNRYVITQLFEWRWADVANECEQFLGPYGFCAVQISPPAENRIVNYRPWFERYQPISYKLSTRSGNETEFRDMVQRCNKAGVRIYADTVINHMAAFGGIGKGTGGSMYNSDTRQFPAVPYGPGDFNGKDRCHSFNGGIYNYDDVEEVRNCDLVGLADLRLGKDYVRFKIAEYMNHLIELGVAGFRIDAAKHMWPNDLALIFAKLKDVKMGGRPFIYQEVIDYRGGGSIKGESYLMNGKITNFKTGRELAAVFRRQNPMRYLDNWGVGWNMWHGYDVINFLDNHDSQRKDPYVLTYRDDRNYKLATAFMLAHPYGTPRLMSSYHFTHHDQGPPVEGGDNIKPVRYSDMACTGGWVCEHRWRQIYNMVAFHNVVIGTRVENWWSGADYQIAFSRGNKGFIAINREDYKLEQWLQTGLPGGDYCDVISGNLENGRCTGLTIHVEDDGKSPITVCNECADPMIAIHVGAKVGNEPRRM